ncbi:MAG: valine--tRNA ligase, partial [Gammaproteobacteria bacterium]
VAVAVHPDDKRYRKLIGKTLKLPLTDRTIPVIADEYVDKEFGTGAVKITPAHDFNDWQIGLRHKLKPLNIFTKDARIIGKSLETAEKSYHPQGEYDIGWDVSTVIEYIPNEYHGLDRFAARKRILADLEAQGLLVETRKHKLTVPISQRSDAAIEPMLTDQWFLDLTRDTLPDGRAGGRKAITEPALNAVLSGDIKFVPENWSTTYIQWLENIQDWCVSRQLWWGHQIPAWYDEAGTIFVGDDEDDAIKHGDKKPVGKLKQDEDVLDTWFSSALWPFSTLGWPSKGLVKNGHGETVANWEQDQVFLPSSVLVTGFDIIFFWVARMVMATRYFTGRVPFREVYINAIVRDAEGQKMSKSKGNTIDPLDLIDGIGLDALVKKSAASLLIPQVREKVTKRIRKDYPQGIPAVGADALRFTFAALAGYSRTINFDLKRCEGYRNFCTKLWNATRFVLMNCEDFNASGTPPLKTPAEHWIVNKLEHLLINVEDHYRTYRFDLLAQDLYEFTWNNFCDWFLELSKPALNGTDKSAADSTRHTLLYVLETLLRALHPIIPFITEELWQQVAPKLGKQGKTISLETYPESIRLAAPSATTDIEHLIAAVIQIRSIRSEMGLSPSLNVPLLIEDRSTDPRRWQRLEASLKFLARLDSLRVLDRGEQAPPAAVAVLEQATLMIPLKGLIDVPTEIARLEKQLEKLRQEQTRTQTKLNNAAFVNGAPAEVITGVRARIKELESNIRRLQAQMAQLRAAQ